MMGESYVYMCNIICIYVLICMSVGFSILIYWWGLGFMEWLYLHGKKVDHPFALKKSMSRNWWGPRIELWPIMNKRTIKNENFWGNIKTT